MKGFLRTEDGQRAQNPDMGTASVTPWIPASDRFETHAVKMLFTIRRLLASGTHALSPGNDGMLFAQFHNQIGIQPTQRSLSKTIKEVFTMQLGEIMTRDVEVVNLNAPLKEAAAMMKKLDVGMVPVCDGDTLKGAVTDRDITIRATAEGCDPNTTKVCDVMSNDLAYCFEDQDIEEAMSLMEAQQIRRLPVLNRNKQLVGIVSLGDLAVHSGQKEMVGDTLKEVSRPAIPRR